MKFIEFHIGITKIIKKLIILRQNHENHLNVRIPIQKHENHENQIIPLQNKENYEILEISY